MSLLNVRRPAVSAYGQLGPTPSIHSGGYCCGVMSVTCSPRCVSCCNWVCDESNDDGASGHDSKLYRNWTPTVFNGSASLSCGGFFRGCAHHAPLPAHPIFLEAAHLSVSHSIALATLPSNAIPFCDRCCPRPSLPEIQPCAAMHILPLSVVLCLNAVSTPSLSYEIRVDKYSAITPRSLRTPGPKEGCRLQCCHDLAASQSPAGLR
ncbi:hypothetical protein AUP68_02798 [Ilyonectria robusta]